MRSVTAFNTGWYFHDGFEDGLREELRPGRAVVLPHSAVELPLAGPGLLAGLRVVAVSTTALTP